MTSNPTATLADFLAGLDYDALPATTRSRVLALVIDALACALLGREGPETHRMEGLARGLSGAGDSTVIGASDRHSLGGATLINSYQITAFNLCDVYRPAHCHISPLVIAPALTAAERRHASGRELLTAVAAGLETTCRVGSALDFDLFRQRGWHSPGVIGPFGGAAATAKIYGLDATATRHALGLAGSQSAGTMAQWGTPTIKFHQSRGALSGLMAGLLAAEGYDAGPNVIAAETGGILNTYSNGGTPEQLTDHLGERWEMLNISLKRWPSGSGLQTTVTSLFELIEIHDMHPSHIENVHVILPRHAFSAHGTMEWNDKFKAMLSARYITSVILHDRRCWIDQFEDARRKDPAVDAFARNQVTVEEDASLSSGAASIEILLQDGSTLTDVRRVPKGDPTDPLEMDQVLEKFRDAARSTGFSPDELEKLMSLDTVDDVAPLIRRMAN